MSGVATEVGVASAGVANGVGDRASSVGEGRAVAGTGTTIGALLIAVSTGVGVSTGTAIVATGLGSVVATCACGGLGVRPPQALKKSTSEMQSNIKRTIPAKTLNRDGAAAGRTAI